MRRLTGARAGNARAILLATAIVIGTAASAHAQLAVVANDGKQPLLGETPNAKARGPDTVSVIDFNKYPASVIGTVEVPVSMIGPPTSLAVSHDNSFAIVTAAQKFDPADGSKLVPDDQVSIIDLASPRHPVLLQTIAAGAGATGVSINRAGTLALVANVDAASVSVFSIRNKRLALVGTVPLGPPNGAGDVTISPDGKVALVTQRRGTGIWRLSIEGTTVKDTGIFIETGQTPYGVVYSRDGNFAFNTNLGGRIVPPDPSGKRTPRDGTVTAIDLRTNKLVTTIDVGSTPEHLALSPDGKYLAVTVVNGSSAKPTSPAYHEFGLLKIYRVDGAALTLVAEAKTGKWGQGAIFRKDNRIVLLQGAADKTIEAYRFDGKTLVRDPAGTLTFATRPSTITTALSR